MAKVVGYARVSTDGQAVDGVSLDAQRAQIEAWAAARGAELIGVFVDAGVSGRRADNRPELQKALALACRSRGGVLVVYSLSRLARSTRDAIEIAEKLRKSRADLVSVTEAIDTTTAAGTMVFTLFAAFAQFERDLTSERTSAALAHKRSRGERVSGRAPYGFRFTEDGSVVADEREQTVAARMRILRASGASLRAIAAALAADGILARNGRPFAAQTVAQIVSDRPVADSARVSRAA